MSTNITPTPGTAERMAYLQARPVLAPAEVQELTALSMSTIRRAIDAGDLPARRIGRRVLIATADALAWATPEPAVAS